MAYCPECGEKVAEIDVFCPFCGISLQADKSADQEASFINTIVAPKPPPATPITDSPIPNSLDEETQTVEETAPTIIEDGEPFENIDNIPEAYSNQNTSENWMLQTKSVDVPAELLKKEIVSEKNSVEETPPIEQDSETALSEVEFIEPEISLANDEEAMHETVVEDVDATEEEIRFDEEDYVATEEDLKLDEEIVESVNEKAIFDEADVEKSESLDSQTESSLTSYEDAEIEEIASAEEPETTSDKIISQPLEPDYVLTIPHVAPSNELENVADADELASFEINDEVVTPSAEIAENKPYETLTVTEEAIDKPVEKLPEITYPPSKFDSVSLLEKEELKDEQIESISEQSSAQSFQEPIVENLDLNQSSDNEIRSNTAPNMGVSDTDGKKRAKLQPLDEGTILNGRYEIVRKIGGGGMGAVYLASDKNLGGVLRAVKEMVQSYIEDTQQDKAISDFKRESMLLTSLEHQAIPTIYDYFFDEKEARFYLVMKYISGGDLASRIRSANEGRIDEKEVTEWAIQIADVLDYLHNRQPPIVYRDLKPANIMIDGNSGRVMLIDFGIARWINKEEKGVTAVGTMGYAPPELFSGNVESRSDIYSLGSTIFHLLTGADPQSNPLLIFDFQKHPRPRQINPQLSDQMEKILMQSVEYAAENRFKSARAMRQALEEHLANLKANRVTFGVVSTSASVGLSEEPVFCGFCGQRIVATDMFCAFCGAKQPLAQHAGHSSESYVSPPPTARLMIIGTNELETPAYKIEKDENLVGRRDPMSNIFPEVDLSKYDPQTKISRRHARIWREGSQFLVEDLGSSNGTVVLPLVNETVRLLPHQPYTLTNGDKLRLGDTTLHFIIG